MADTRVQIEIEDWVRGHWMSATFNEPFYRQRVRLDAGGLFDFDAVNQSGSIVASISTSAALTSSGKHAVAKLQKLRADMLFLLMATSCSKRLMVLTEQSMFERLQKEKVDGRMPQSIEILHAALPENLVKRLAAAQLAASREMGSERTKSDTDLAA